jgi:EAL domain-containing protein (putative c-di-GMP-specific phosphodiesterase class I)
VTLADQLDSTRRTRTAIEELIADPAQLGPDFQPIVRLGPSAGATPGDRIGWKATGRGKAGSTVGDTLSLLSGAQSLGLVERLDWAFRCHAFDVALRDGLSGELHLTPEPETFRSACPPRLAVAWGRGRRALQVVAELHLDAFVDPEVLRDAVEEMRGWGWRLAVADLSTERAVAAELAWLRPEYVQLDVGRPDRVTDSAVRSWLVAAAGVGATVMAIGVDSEASRMAALTAGASCGRGSLLGEPGDLPR